ncbi:hypothetical protein M9458_042838, partial [Cirrhinus mrigala]
MEKRLRFDVRKRRDSLRQNCEVFSDFTPIRSAMETRRQHRRGDGSGIDTSLSPYSWFRGVR